MTATERKQRGNVICKDALTVHADTKTGVIQLPAPQRSNALENFGLLRRRVLVQPVLEQRCHPVGQPQRDRAGVLRTHPRRGGQNGGQLMLSQARDHGSHEHTYGYTSLGEGVDGR